MCPKSSYGILSLPFHINGINWLIPAYTNNTEAIKVVELSMTKKKLQKLQAERERQTLLHEIETTRQAHAIALSNLENITDPDLIDCYIYELNAVQVRYKFLLRLAKQKNLTNLPSELPDAYYSKGVPV